MGLLPHWLSNFASSQPTSLSLPFGAGGPYFWGYVAFSNVMQLFEQYLELRQLRKNRELCMPPEVKMLGIDNDSFVASQQYNKDKRIFSMVRSWISFGFSYLSLVVINPALWRFSSRICGAGNEYRTTLLWLFIQQWVDKPLGIACSLYSNFVVEEKHGFNKMTYKLFCSDLVKSEVLSYAFGAPLVSGLIWVVRWGGKRFYLYAWGCTQTLLFAFMWIYPNFIQPLFNKFEALKDEELRTKIESLAAEEKFPLTKLYQIDGSKRSSHSNAYFFGFWKNKRIVIYDTLLTLSHDQILAVLCHELGHWKFNHVTVNLVISSVHTFVLFWMFGQAMYSGRTSKDLVQAFGFADTNAIIISLSTYQMLIEPLERVIMFLMTLRTRANEFQADNFAAKRGRSEELASGLLQMTQENKGDLTPDPLYAWYHFSHPHLLERIRALGLDAEKLQKKQQ